MRVQAGASPLAGTGTLVLVRRACLPPPSVRATPTRNETSEERDANRRAGNRHGRKCDRDEARGARPRGDDGLAHRRQRAGDRMGELRRATGARQGTFADATSLGELSSTALAGVHTLEALEASRRATSREGPDRRREPARLLAGHAAHAVGLQHRLARRADPARVPGAPGREGAEHDELHVMVDPVSSRATTTCSCAAPTTRRSRTRSACSRASAGPREDRRPRGHPAARGTEAYLLFWIRLWGALQTGHFNIRVVAVARAATMLAEMHAVPDTAARHRRDEVRRVVGRRRRQGARRRAAPRRGARARAARRRHRLGDGQDDRLADRARPRGLAAARRARARHAALDRRAHLVRARRDGDPRPRLRGRLVHRLAGRHRHRRRHTPAKIREIRAQRVRRRARRGQDRARRRLPGRLARHQRRHHARPRRHRRHRGRARGRARRGLRDLLRRRRRLHRRSAHRPGRPQAAAHLLRGDARDVGVGREGADAALGRARPQPQRPRPLPLDVLGRGGHLDRPRRGSHGTADHLGVTHSRDEVIFTLTGIPDRPGAAAPSSTPSPPSTSTSTRSSRTSCTAAPSSRSRCRSEDVPATRRALAFAGQRSGR